MEDEGTRSRQDLTELATLVDALVNEIAEARHHYQELAAVVDSVEAEADPFAAQARGTTSIMDEAHLSALALATAGGSRDDAREHLRSAFGLENPDSIVDEAFAAVGHDGGLATAPRRRFARRRREA